MSKVCDVCQRGPKRANKVSHAKNRTPSRQNINLQSKKIDGKRTKVCTSCIRTMAKQVV